MSFPSAAAFIAANPHATAEEALLNAAQRDTYLGYRALQLLAGYVRNRPYDGVVERMKFDLNNCGGAIPISGLADTVLRSEDRGEGIKVDFDPLSKLGGQIARLMTDVMRPIMEQHFAVKFGFANCCVLVSTDSDDVTFTAEDQVRWQVMEDC